MGVRPLGVVPGGGAAGGQPRDDADTTGAVFGQLAGAFYGEAGIPAEWRALLARRELIETLADGLHQAATA